MKKFTLKFLSAAIGVAISHSVAAQNLLDLYQTALKEDRAYQAALATSKSVKMGEDIADSNYYPSLDLSADAYSIDNDPKVGSSENYQSHSVTLTAVQPLYNRDISIASESAKLSSTKADHDLQSSRQDLIVRLATAYFEVLASLDTRTFVEADKKAIARQLDQAQQRFDVGLIAITAVHEAQAAYDQAIANEIAVNNRLDQAYEALREIVGEMDLNLDPLSADAIFESPNPANLDAWSETAQANNPALLAARQTAELALKNIEQQRNGHFPTLNLVGSQTYSDVDNKTTDTGYDRTTVGLTFDLPLYAGGGVDAAVKQAQLDFEAAQFNLEKQQRSVTRQVKDAYRGVIASISQIKALEAVRVSAKSALDATEAGYEVGTRTIVDVLNAQRNLYEALNNYADARYQFMVNLLSLKQAAGTLAEADIEHVNQWLKPAG